MLNIKAVKNKMKGVVKMDFGVTSKWMEYAFGNSSKQSTRTDKSQGVSFLELAALKAAEKASKQEETSKQEKNTENSLKEMWQTRFPGGYYHVMDVSKSPEYFWGRYDFPFEKFFSDTVDESILDWKAKGAPPKLTDSSVQSRIDSTLGKNAIIVPPALEEKMKNNPILAQKIMTKVENFIVRDEAMVPGRICSHLIVLDENGEISSRSIGSSGGGNIVGPTEEEQKQFEAEQKEKEKRRKKYAQLNEESALKRKLQEQEADKVYYHNSKIKGQVFVSYEQNSIQMATVQK